MDAAEILCVREIDLFRLAWHEWFGGVVDEDAVERAFAGYMFAKRVPPWVRAYVRTVFDRAERGKLQRIPHGVIRRRSKPPVVWPGAIYVGIVMIVALLFILMLTGTTYDPQTSAPMACETGPGMRWLAQLIYRFSRLEPPDCL